MTIYKQYQQFVNTDTHRQDSAQLEAVRVLASIQHKLYERYTNDKPGLLSRLKQLIIKQSPPVTGIYLWGDVGRGKTWLMNIFYETLPVNRKQRQHFHHFMLDIHERLSRPGNKKDPLKQIATDLSYRYDVICLDEFIVTNITDAMLLYRLLQALFDSGVTLIATSNRIPDDLYLNGLQREQFLPAIELIKHHCRIYHLDGDSDHRLSLLEKFELYYSPINEATENSIKQRLNEMASTDITYNQTIQVLGRTIEYRACADEIIWFDFEQLCDAPRAAQDYIEIAADYHTVLLSNVPVMNEYLDDKARRFIYLIDELYDRRVKLIISAETTPEQLYIGTMLKFAFNRTRSRLIEMRSEAYLAEPHRCEQ